MSDYVNYMKPTPSEILQVRHETNLEYTFRIKTDVQVKPGQFMMLSIPMVGEAPISVSDEEIGWLEFTIRKVGKVTDAIFEKEAGDFLFLRGPYGNGWPMEKIQGKNLVVIAGGTGVSPVRGLLNYCVRNRNFVKNVAVILGFKSQEAILFKEDLAKWEKNFTTWFCLDNEEIPGWHKGFVTGYVKEIPVATYGLDYAAIVVGPPPMMKFTGIEMIKDGFNINNIWMSFERKMSCGLGKCGHCRIDEYYVCVDGPVFPYKIAKDLVD